MKFLTVLSLVLSLAPTVYAEAPADQAERAKLLRELLADAAGHPEAGTKAGLAISFERPAPSHKIKKE